MTQEKEYVWHYTSIEAAYSIITNNTLWATHINWLNDEDEMRLPMEHFIKGVEDKFPNSNTNKFVADFVLYSLQNPVGVISFSKSCNVLSQWRSYGDDGHGVALGFPIDRILHCEPSNSATFTAMECIYEDYQAVIDKLLSEFGARIFEYEQTKNGDFFPSILLTLCKLKHSAFEEEKEVRFVINTANGMDDFNTRANGRLIVPYLEIALPEAEAFKKDMVVVLGPQCDIRNEQLLKTRFDFEYQQVRRFYCGYRT